MKIKFLEKFKDQNSILPFILIQSVSLSDLLKIYK